MTVTRVLKVTWYTVNDAATSRPPRRGAPSRASSRPDIARAMATAKKTGVKRKVNVSARFGWTNTSDAQRTASGDGGTRHSRSSHQEVSASSPSATQFSKVPEWTGWAPSAWNNT